MYVSMYVSQSTNANKSLLRPSKAQPSKVQYNILYPLEKVLTFTPKIILKLYLIPGKS